MSESTPNKFENNREQKKQEFIALALELSESGENFPFPGMNPDNYLEMKATQEEFPGFQTPIDELIERFNKDGIEVSLGSHPESGNVYILPSGSGDIEMDGIPPKYLNIDSVKNDKIRQLIQMEKDLEQK